MRFIAHPKNKSRHSGFSIIELVVALLVVAVIASIAVPFYGNIKNRSYMQDALNDGDVIFREITATIGDSNVYPTLGSTNGTISLDTSSTYLMTITLGSGVTSPTPFVEHLSRGTTVTGLTIANTVDWCIDVANNNQHAIFTQSGLQNGYNACTAGTPIYNSSAVTDLTGIYANPAYDPTNITATQVTGITAGADTTAVEVSILRTQAIGWGYYFKYLTRSQQAGTTGTVSFWARGTAGAYTTITPQICNDPATVCPWTGSAKTLTGGWQQFVLPYTLTADVVEGTHYLRFGVGNAGVPLTIQITGVTMVNPKAYTIS